MKKKIKEITTPGQSSKEVNIHYENGESEVKRGHTLGQYLKLIKALGHKTIG